MLDYKEEIIEIDSMWDAFEDWIECHTFTILSITSIITMVGVWVLTLSKWVM